MRTVGHHWPKGRPRDDFVCQCDVCGAHYPRSKLVRDDDNLLKCPRDAKGRDEVELSKLQAQNAQRPNFTASQTGGSYETLPIGTPPVVRRPE
jgi:hypothetical protein